MRKREENSLKTNSCSSCGVGQNLLQGLVMFRILLPLTKVTHFLSGSQGNPFPTCLSHYSLLTHVRLKREHVGTHYCIFQVPHSFIIEKILHYRVKLGQNFGISVNSLCLVLYFYPWKDRNCSNGSLKMGLLISRYFEHTFYTTVFLEQLLRPTTVQGSAYKDFKSPKAFLIFFWTIC